jgi:ubiquinone/menaquinone biosynthesis C-methylase UbiE
MSFLCDCVAGSLMDLLMSRKAFSAQRADLLKDVGGEVLEIGFGTGLNMPHYTPKVTRLTVIDPAAFLPKRVAARVAASPFPVERVQLSAERLPFEDHRFDYVVSTWTLCTIPNVTAALREVCRVLKPAGHFVFLEHGRSENVGTARWQDRLNPIQKFIGGGRNLNRKIDDLITVAGLHIQRLDRYHMAGPRPWTEMYRGIATAGE